MGKRFHARIFNLCNSEHLAEYEALMQRVTDGDNIELADDKKGNWDKLGNYNVALEYFEVEDD